MSDQKLSLTERWAKLPSGSKTLYGGAVILTAVLILGTLWQESGTQKKAETPPRAEVFNPPNGGAAQTVEGTAAQLQATQESARKTQDEINLLKEQLRQKDLQSTPDGKYSEISNLTAQVQALQERLNGMSNGAQNLNSGNANNLPAPSLNSSLPNPGDNLGGKSTATEQETTPAASIQVVGGEGRKKENKKVTQKVVAYLPAGSNFEAILINGMDASTGVGANKIPTPALLRVKTEAILPNLFNQDVNECFVLVGGFGNLSSERVEMRTEKMSCVAQNGETFEADIQGYVVGEDGKVGPRGRVVSKQGALLARSFMAGFVGGIGSAFTPQAIPSLNTSGSQTYNYPNADYVLGSGVGNGLNKSGTMLAQFYLEMAKQMFPIIELDAGRKVTIILIKGTEVRK